MSVQNALDFFAAVRERPELRERIAAWGSTPTAGQLVELAARAGFPCSETELQEGYRHDWAMRWFAQR